MGLGSMLGNPCLWITQRKWRKTQGKEGRACYGVWGESCRESCAGDEGALAQRHSFGRGSVPHRYHFLQAAKGAEGRES